jgi:hypothetical protein
VSPKIATLPVTEPAMWKKLLAKVHPDADGDHELFIWAMNLRELVCEGGFRPPPAEASPPPPPPPPPRTADRDRVPFDRSADFTKLTWRALQIAEDEDIPLIFAKLLQLLMDCEEALFGKQRDQQHLGASYKQLTLIAHKVRMTKDQRQQWYRLAERVPLSMRHASHIISRMGG